MSSLYRLFGYVTTTTTTRSNKMDKMMQLLSDLTEIYKNDNANVGLDADGTTVCVEMQRCTVMYYYGEDGVESCTAWH
jgi:hypothetical protein